MIGELMVMAVIAIGILYVLGYFDELKFIGRLLCLVGKHKWIAYKSFHGDTMMTLTGCERTTCPVEFWTKERCTYYGPGA